MCGFAIQEVVEGVPEDFSIDGDGSQLCLPVIGDVCFRIFQLKENGMLPEHLLDNLRIEPSQNVTDGRVGRCTLPGKAECCVQSAQMRLDKGVDASIGVGACDNGKDREQQHLRKRVDFAFSTPVIGNVTQH